MFCTVAEVKSAISFPSTGAPVSDADITGFILDSQEEIEDIYKTMFGNVEISGTADGDYSTTTFSDSGETWTADEYVGYVVWIYGGVGSGQYREITTNTTTKLTVSPAFDTVPDATSTYRITKLGYKDDTVDGDGTDNMLVNYQPLVSLNALTVDSVSVTPAYVYQYLDSGKLVLGTSDVEAVFFADSRPQLVNLKYVFGVYPMPRIIKRLCVVMSGMRTLASQIAGTYNDFTSVSLPGGFTGSKGEPFTNIRAALDKLQAEAKGIVYGDSSDALGADFRRLPSYRPYMVFG